MKHEEDMQEDAEPELSALLRDALRSETPAGLSDEQRARLQAACAEFEAERRAARSTGRESKRAAPPASKTKSAPRRARLGWLALACILPVAAYFGVDAHVRHEQEAAARELAHARERAAQIAAQAQAEAAARAEAIERARAERALVEAKARLEAAVASPAHAALGSDDEQEDAETVRAGSEPKKASGKASSRAGSRASSRAKAAGGGSSGAGGCDPNDPLCGL